MTIKKAREGDGVLPWATPRASLGFLTPRSALAAHTWLHVMGIFQLGHRLQRLWEVQTAAEAQHRDW